MVINFEDVTLEVIQTIEKKYPKEFLESYIVNFSHFKVESEDRVKLILKETLYLITMGISLVISHIFKIMKPIS